MVSVEDLQRWWLEAGCFADGSYYPRPDGPNTNYWMARSSEKVKADMREYRNAANLDETHVHSGQSYRDLVGRGVRLDPSLWVHLDLKGAPPTVAFLCWFAELIRDWGAEGVVMEWEDTLPFNGVLACASRAECYSTHEVIQILRAFHQCGLRVMPLVQTLGHLQFLLSRDEFVQLRETCRKCDQDPAGFETVRQMFLRRRFQHKSDGAANIPTIVKQYERLNTCFYTLCLTTTANTFSDGVPQCALDLVTELLSQTLRFHALAKVPAFGIHIGFDEPIGLATCHGCQQIGHTEMRENVVKHLESVVATAKSQIAETNKSLGQAEGSVLMWRVDHTGDGVGQFLGVEQNTCAADDDYNLFSYHEQNACAANSEIMTRIQRTGVEMVMWAYGSQTPQFCQEWQKLGVFDVFDQAHCWAASTWREGIQHPARCYRLPPVAWGRNHIERHDEWRRQIIQQPHYKALLLTGWAKGHAGCQLNCELLPASLISLGLCINTARGLSKAEASTEVERGLSLPAGQLLPLLTAHNPELTFLRWAAKSEHAETSGFGCAAEQPDDLPNWLPVLQCCARTTLVARHGCGQDWVSELQACELEAALRQVVRGDIQDVVCEMRSAIRAAAYGAGGLSAGVKVSAIRKRGHHSITEGEVGEVIVVDEAVWSDDLRSGAVGATIRWPSGTYKSKDWRADAEMVSFRDGVVLNSSETIQSFYIVRHADRMDGTGDDSYSQWSAAKGLNSAQVRRDCPISTVGEEQAEATGRWLQTRGIRTVISSPYLRALQTAYPIARRSCCKIKVEEGVSEGWHEHIDTLISQQISKGVEVRAIRSSAGGHFRKDDLGVVTNIDGVRAMIRWQHRGGTHWTDDWRDAVRVTCPSASEIPSAAFDSAHASAMIPSRGYVCNGVECERFPEEFLARNRDYASYLVEQFTPECGNVAIVTHGATSLSLVSVLTAECELNPEQMKADQQHIGHIDTCGVFRVDRLRGGGFLLRGYSKDHVERPRKKTPCYFG